MSIINNGLLLASGADAAVGYQISRSLRFNSADSAYLSRTPGSAGNQKTYTLSMWIKRSNLGQKYFFGSYYGGSSRYQFLGFNSSDQLVFFGGIYTTGGSTTDSVNLITTAVYRDVSAWYHLVLAVDTTQATSTDRVKLYVNGTQVTNFGTATYPAQNTESYINSVQPHYLGDWGGGGSISLDGYIADVYLLDGTATTPSTFAETDAVTGQWVPKTPTSISYGTNGFRLTFSDNSGTTSTTLGKDAAGSNNWTPNNFSVASGSGNDSLTDSPTSYGTDTGAGGQVRGNYCTWNPLDTIGGNTFSNGNLDIQTVTAAYGTCRGTIGVSSGKWYWEIDVLDETGGGQIGIIDSVSPLPSEPYLAARGYVYFDFGSKGNNSSQASYGASYTTGDLIGVALDLDAGTLAFYKNGSSQGTAYSSLPSGTVFFPVIADYQSANSSKFALNAGQRAFAYTAPSGFKALCDTNLTAPTIAKPADYFDAKTYSGNNSTQTISLNFSPDFIWLKCRNSARSHRLIDTVRGLSYQLFSNDTAGGSTYDATSYASSVASTSSSGFTVDNSGSDQYNTSGETYVAWAWDAASSNSTNTSGTITSTVRANATAGFSVVSWTSDGSSSIRTMGHGLGATPALVIIKNRDISDNWTVYHSSFSNIVRNYIFLNSTAAVATRGIDLWSTFSSTTFGLDQTFVAANGQKCIAYCFAPVAGYSAFGSYTGNGSTDGVFVHLGFRPKWLMVKRTDAAEYWIVFDAIRNTYNIVDLRLLPSASNAEGSLSSNPVDFLSNGFKNRGSDTFLNGSGATYIYAAFAENPFQYARAR